MWNQKVLYRIMLKPIPSHINPTYLFPLHFFMISFYILDFGHPRCVCNNEVKYNEGQNTTKFIS